MRAAVRLLGGNNENVFDSVGKRRLHWIRMRIFESFNHHSHESWAGFPVSTLCLFSWSREMHSLPLSSRLQTIMMSIRVRVSHTFLHSQTHSQSICSHSLRSDTNRPFPFANPSDSSRFSTLLSWNPPSYPRFSKFWSSVADSFSHRIPNSEHIQSIYTKLAARQHVEFYRNHSSNRRKWRKSSGFTTFYTPFGMKASLLRCLRSPHLVFILFL